MSRIKDIKIRPVEYRYKKTFHIANSSTDVAKNVEIELITEEGFTGRGEASPSYRVCGETQQSIISFVQKIDDIKGIDVRNYRKIFEITDRLISSPALKAAVQFATIHAMCNEIGIKVWEFFGGMSDSIETDKTVSIGTIDEMVKEAIDIKKKGFKVIKIKVGEDVDHDVEAVEEIYSKTKGMKYIVDANCGYSVKDAIYFAKKLYSKGIDIDLFEQPVDRYDIDGLKLVRKVSVFPICADESAKTKYDVLNIIKNDACDFINIKLMKCGLSDAISIIDICQTARKGLMIGCMGESSLGINQSVQLACGYGVFKFCDLDSHLMIYENESRGDFIQNKGLIKVI